MLCGHKAEIDKLNREAEMRYKDISYWHHVSKDQAVGRRLAWDLGSAGDTRGLGTRPLEEVVNTQYQSVL